MGVVFVAEQTAPGPPAGGPEGASSRGWTRRQVVARFEAERQALALMDHPNIARVLDAGHDRRRAGRTSSWSWSSGVPDHRLLRPAPADRPASGWSCSSQVCQAVQHAHQKGIIHRDLKPSNVLVTLHDGEPVPKVIDFGVAKAIGQQLTEQTLFTGFAQMVGTPLYMCPEQAELSGLDVDTRSDIYSLGVLLYELLTGHDAVRPGAAAGRPGYDEMRRIIREEEPPRPSTRVSTLGQAAATVSANRRTRPAAAAPAVPRRAGLDRDEGAGEGPQPPVRDGQRASRRTCSGTWPTSRCRRARRRRGTASASSPGGTSGRWSTASVVGLAALLAVGGTGGEHRPDLAGLQSETEAKASSTRR